MLMSVSRRLLNSNIIVTSCLGALVFLPLIAAATFGIGMRAERARFELFATVSSALEAFQDAEVDFSLARRSAQSFMRTGADTDRTAVKELSAATRVKLQAAKALLGDDGVAADVAAIDHLIADYAGQATAVFDLIEHRDNIANVRLRSLGDQIDVDLATYAERWKRVGLVELAGELARARIIVAKSNGGGIYSPDDLEKAMLLPIGLALAAEIPVPAASELVSRIRVQLGEFLGLWRELIVLEQRVVRARDSLLIASGREASTRLQRLTNRLQTQLAALLVENRRDASRNNFLMWSMLVFVFAISLAGAAAAWAAYSAQRQRARIEAERRSAIEDALAKLDAMIRAMRSGGGDVVLRLPVTAPSKVVSEHEPEPRPAFGSVAEPPLPVSKPARVTVHTAVSVPDTTPDLMARPKRKPLRRTPPADRGLIEPAPVKAAEPDTDALLAMLMQSIAESGESGQGEPRP